MRVRPARAARYAPRVRILGNDPAGPAPERADELADMVLQDHAGEEHRLGDYWSNGPAALVFLRHYG
jgi:hypothetical protein